MASIVESHGLLSPAASAPSPSPSGVYSGRGLPIPRSHPLQPGGKKETFLINYVDEKILHITRRYGKKFSDSNMLEDDAPGYTSFDQVITDIEALFEVVWISGTPAVQIPYLLSLAGLVCSYMPAFPFSPSTFHLTRRLDLAFVSLLRDGRDSAHTNSDGTSQKVSTTDKVRMKSLIEDTRVVAIETATESGHTAQIQEVSSSEETDDDDMGEENDMDDLNYDDISIGISKIYKQTMEILGDTLVLNKP